MTHSQLSQLQLILRGLLAEATGDEDIPFRPAILKRLTESEENALRALDNPLLLDPSGFSDLAEKELREALGAVIAEYECKNLRKPSDVWIKGLCGFSMEPNPADPHKPLAGKVAIVTGAAGAIGYGICEGLIGKGASVAATDISAPALDAMIEEFRPIAGDRIIGVQMDVSDPDSVANGFNYIIETWGGIDIVVVNAGIAHVAPLTDLDLETFRKLEKVNVEGTLLTLAEAARRLKTQSIGGDIVLISTKNVFAPGARFGAYSATKAASHQLARIASLELAEFGIRVNMVAPDAVFSGGTHKSGLWAAVGPDRMKARGLDEKGLEDYYKSRNLLKARVTAKHVSNAVLFFVTRQTPTTGATIPVDGGLPDSTPR